MLKKKALAGLSEGVDCRDSASGMKSRFAGKIVNE